MSDRTDPPAAMHAYASPTSPAAAPELTRRAIVTGMVLGAALTPCNVYSGLKIGWSFNMSIAAGLVAAGIWGAARSTVGSRPLGLLENNINQTTASSAASIVSGGLVAPIPALTMLTGERLDWHLLAVWVFAVSALGIVVAAALRRQMIVHEKLRFPAGVATAETMTQVHSRGREAAARLQVLMAGAAVSAAVKLAVELAAAVPRLAPAIGVPGAGALRAAGQGAPTMGNLGLSLDPSLLMVGFGAIIGLRAGISLLLGALAAWVVLAPYILLRGWVVPGAPEEEWFGPLVEWLLWPGVTLIVVSALLSFALSVAGLNRRPRDRRRTRHRLPSGRLALGLVAASALVVVAGSLLFGLSVWEALVAVALSFVLAVVAARVTGETGVTPIGALGKVTQLTYGILSPGNVTANLMSANVTGGAAGQCADLMQDLKTGHLIGATPHLQIMAQCFGVLVGSLVGTVVYLTLIPDPAAMLITPEWPAPAVATWKAVAEVLSRGLTAIPEGALTAMTIAAAVAVAAALAERLAPEPVRHWVPSAPAVGLAFVIPAWNSISLFLGALAAAVIGRVAPGWAERRTVALAAGLVAGESLLGVAFATGSLLG